MLLKEKAFYIRGFVLAFSCVHFILCQNFFIYLQAFLVKYVPQNIELVMLRTRLKRQKDLWIKNRVEEGLKNLIYFQNKSHVNKVRLQNFNLLNTYCKT